MLFTANFRELLLPYSMLFVFMYSMNIMYAFFVLYALTLPVSGLTFLLMIEDGLANDFSHRVNS